MRTTVKVVSTGKGVGASSISRYIAERDRDLEKEGKEPRPLFDAKEDRLTYRQADNVLSRGSGAPAKEDVLHVVVSLRPGDYERFGESDEERKDVFRSVVREAMQSIERDLHAEDLKWFAGIHLNTDNPHVHLAISKEMTDAESGAPKRFENIPRNFKPHYEKAQQRELHELPSENGSKTLTDVLVRSAEAGEAAAKFDSPSPREGERGERGIVYLNVSHDDPCPVCHKPDYCSVVNRTAGEILAPEVDGQASGKGRFMPGKMADRFLEAMERHTVPVRAIGFKLADKELLLRREIVGDTERAPSPEERLVGSWIMGETAHQGVCKGRETLNERAERLSLQRQVRELDHAGHERGEPLTAAHIPAKELNDAIAEGRIAALHQDGRMPRPFETPGVEATLTPVEKRRILGAELTARLEVEYWSDKLREAEEQGAMRRYRAHDPTMGTSRRISQHDIEQRAKAGAYQEANASQPDTAAERVELRRDLYHAEVNRHQETTETIEKRHKRQVGAVRAEHSQTLHRHDELAPQAAGIERQFVAAGEPLPIPVIERDVLDKMHEQAVERRDAWRIKTLDQIRHALSEEFGSDAHTDKSAARLEAQLSVATRDLAVTDMRIENFEQSRHQRQWNFGDEKWSLSDVDRELSRSARDIDFNERRSAYFENRLSWRGLLPHPSQLNPFRNSFDISPSKLSPLPPALNPATRAHYREEMEAGREAIRIAQEKIETLTPLREVVVKRIDAHRGELHAERIADREMVNTLSAMRSREAATREARGAQMPEHAYTSWELRRLETNAAHLRDGENLREYEHAAERAVTRQIGALRTEKTRGGYSPYSVIESMAVEEPTTKQMNRLRELGAVDAPESRWRASRMLEELTGQRLGLAREDRNESDPGTAAAKTRDRMAGRAFARESVAEIDLRDAEARVEQLDEYRAGVRVVYKDVGGEDRTATLRDVQPKSWLDRLTQHLTETAEAGELRKTVEYAVTNTYSMLLDSRDSAQGYLNTVRDVANEYREGLRAIDPQRALPAPQFTDNELAKIERFGKGLEAGPEREQIKELVSSALHENRVGHHPLGKDFAEHAKIYLSLNLEHSWERAMQQPGVEPNRERSNDIDQIRSVAQTGRVEDAGRTFNSAAGIDLVL